ncbi:unnamed protein product [Citrullus colocynthis]|uniref:Uncharacterized protein n=1 Tax=Citrullus colocynthis TaxID=252529 RepID=A0ABP0Y6M5_9ROSI
MACTFGFHLKKGHFVPLMSSPNFFFLLNSLRNQQLRVCCSPSSYHPLRFLSRKVTLGIRLVPNLSPFR